MTNACSSRTDEEILEALMRPLGDAYETEILNRSHQNNARPLFNAESLDDLFDHDDSNENKEHAHTVSGLATSSTYFALSLDPGGVYGRKGSDSAITSATWTHVLPGQPALDPHATSGDISQLYTVVWLGFRSLLPLLFPPLLRPRLESRAGAKSRPHSTREPLLAKSSVAGRANDHVDTH